MEMNNGLAALIVILMLGAGIFVGAVGFSKTEQIETEKVVIQEKLVNVEKECPVIVCQDVTIPEIQNADNELLNEFLENEFSANYTEIKDEAYFVALEELEDHDYRVVVEYLMSLIEGVDEDLIDVDVDDFEVKVTKLGLGEDEDKSATVTFELEVNYELEEGVNDDFNKDIIVVYNVVFDEGDFGDEDVELVSIN